MVVIKKDVFTSSDLIQVALRCASETDHLMDGTMKPVLDILASHDIVFGIWPDSRAAEGFDMVVIKGGNILRDSVATNAPTNAKVSAVRCIEAEQAYALMNLEGDRLQ